MKYYVACVFVSELDDQWFEIQHFHSRKKCRLRYLSSSGVMHEFATNNKMPNSLAMLIHSFDFVFIHKPRVISIIYTPHLSFNPVAVERWSF